MRSIILFVSILTLFVFLLLGCGGGKSGSNPPPTNDPTTSPQSTPTPTPTPTGEIAQYGGAQFTIQWSERTRLIPAAAQSIKIALSGPTSSEQVILRPEGNNATTSTVSFPQLLVGNYNMTAIAYPESNAQGIPQATASMPLKINQSQTTINTLSLNSNITHVVLSSSANQVYPKQKVDLSIQARDIQNNLVLTDPIQWEWTTSSSDLMLIKNGSLVSITPQNAGIFSVYVREKESGQSAQLSLSSTAITIERLNDLPDVNDPFNGFNTYPQGVSYDGRVIVGVGYPDAGQNTAFIWTPETGTQRLSGSPITPYNTYRSEAAAVSADGKVVAGEFILPSGVVEAFRWTRETGMVSIQSAPSNDRGSISRAISADGKTIVGTIKTGGLFMDREAFIWTQETGMIGIGDLPGGDFYSQPEAVSGDGSVIVGQSKSWNGSEAFYWSKGGGMIGLGDAPLGAFSSIAACVSGDGKIVLGGASGDATHGSIEIFSWTQQTGLVEHGTGLIGAYYPNGMSSDGRVAICSGRTTNSYEFFLWTHSKGGILLVEYLKARGVDTTGFRFDGIPISISGDGKTIVGIGGYKGINGAYRVHNPLGFDK
jgi:probable HAF family extracellular repeat protein